MKKFGFTLSEVIIALGIVGVLAAITAPLITSVIPDKNKVLVLKAYKTLTDINQDLLADTGLYMSDGLCTGFNCDQRPTRFPFNTEDYQGTKKYRKLVFSKLNSITNIQDDCGSIMTKDGITWTIDNLSVEIDIDSNGKDCAYDKTSCKKPDKFKFAVSLNGRVSGNDPLTRAYLSNPYKLNDRKKDLKSAGG